MPKAMRAAWLLWAFGTTCAYSLSARFGSESQTPATSYSHLNTLSSGHGVWLIASPAKPRADISSDLFERTPNASVSDQPLNRLRQRARAEPVGTGAAGSRG